MKESGFRSHSKPNVIVLIEVFQMREHVGGCVIIKNSDKELCYKWKQLAYNLCATYRIKADTRHKKLKISVKKVL